MAALSEADLKKILGVNYKEVDSLAPTPESVRQEAAKRFVARVEKCDANKFNALALAFLGVVLLAANLSGMSGPPALPVSAFSVVLMIAGAGWYIYSFRELRALRAASPAT